MTLATLNRLQEVRLHPARALAAACLLLAVATMQAGGARPPTLDPTYGMPLPKPRVAEPEANWIWANRVADNQTVFLRAGIDLSRVPERAVLYITGDDFWTLYVNGKQVLRTRPNPKDGMVWRHVLSPDIAPYLTTGKNVIAVRALNTLYAAGVVARLELDGKPVLLSDATWRASEATDLPADWNASIHDDSAWQSATIIGPLSADNWSGQLDGWPNDHNGCPFLHHLPMRPVAFERLHQGDGEITGERTLTGRGPTNLVARAAPQGSKDPPSLIVDFGCELTGRVELVAAGPAVVVVSLGESADEAAEGPWCSVQLVLTPGKRVATPYSAFRYARLVFISGGPEDIVTLTDISLDHLYYPVEYNGSFRCSDKLLTRVWYTGAHTAHMCMQEEIWDAPKRDRWHWMGDLHVSGEVINNVFMDRFLMEKTLSVLRLEAQGGNPESSLPRSHVNGIPGYSCAWIAGLADFHRHAGDFEYLRRQHDLLISMLEFFRGELDERGVFANKRGAWTFCDWAPDFGGGPLANTATHMFLVKAVREGAFLLSEMGDTASASTYSAWADALAEAGRRHLTDPATGIYSDRRQDNAMSVYSGAASPEQAQAIFASVLRPGAPAWDKVATPYYNNYVIFAMSMSGHTAEALQIVRSHWGGMIAQGATSFWEGYDPKWEKTKFHAHLQACNATGYSISLCHGWSAGATSFLTERVLGVRPTSGGFRTAEVIPDLGDLRWAEGDVPTPNGPIHVRVEKTKRGLRLKLELPDKVEAEVGVPGSKATVSGRAVDPVKIDGDRAFVRITGAGKYLIEGT